MADGADRRERSAWRRSSAIVAMIHNVNAAKGKGKSPDDFNPYLAARPKPVLKVGIEALMMFVPGGRERM